MKKQLEHVILITGAGGLIGRASAVEAALTGNKLSLVDIDMEA